MYIHIEFKRNFLTWADNAPSQNQRAPNRNPDTRHKKPSFERLIRIVQETPQTYRVFLMLLVAPRCGWLRPLLLKTPCTSNTETRVPWAEADLNGSSLRTNFHGTRRRYTNFQGGKQPTALPSYDTYEPHNGQRGKLTWRMQLWTHTLVVTQNSLIGLKIHSATGKSCLVLGTKPTTQG